jgi:hypothetical protein
MLGQSSGVDRIFDWRPPASGSRLQPRTERASVRRLVSAQQPRPDRDSLASRPSDQRGARADRVRPRPQERVRAYPGWEGRQAPNGGDRRLGLGARQHWTRRRVELPVGPLFCILDGPTRGRAWSATGARAELRQLAAQAGVCRRFAPHQLRHAPAVEMAHEGIPLPVIQRQLGHAHLGITSIHLQGIDTSEIINTVHDRRPRVIPASAGLNL